MLDDCKDHILLVQEHWRLESELIVWQNTARRKGWHGIWEAAKATEKNQDGITGRSGGVAILTWNGRSKFASNFEADYRVLGAKISSGRTKTLHIFGFDGQNNYERGNISIRDRLGKFITQLGRVPWVIGGDWNAQPGTCH